MQYLIFCTHATFLQNAYLKRHVALHSLRKSVQAMLLAIATDEVLSEYSMEGRTGKRAFSPLSLTPFIEGKPSGVNDNYGRDSAATT